jgi:hypothetical protein
VAHLKLGPLPKQNAERVTIVLSEPLKEELSAYAAEHSRLYEPTETTALIPRMLLAFLRTNRAGSSSRDGWPSLQSLETEGGEGKLVELSQIK